MRQIRIWSGYSFSFFVSPMIDASAGKVGLFAYLNFLLLENGGLLAAPRSFFLDSKPYCLTETGEMFLEKKYYPVCCR